MRAWYSVIGVSSRAVLTMAGAVDSKLLDQ